MIRIAICEDVKREQIVLQNSIKKTKLFSKPCFELFDNGQSLIDKYNDGERYDFVFLDVDMPLLNGIDAGKLINSIDSRAIIVFVTNYPQYAIEAYDCSAFNYLLKNSDFDRFYSVIAKAVEKYKTFHQTYKITTKGGIVTLNVSDIYFVECCQKHLYFHMENIVYETKKTLSEVYEKLFPFGFYQIHQGYIVNFDKVMTINGYDVILENKEKVMISVRKKTEVIRAYSSYVRRVM